MQALIHADVMKVTDKKTTVKSSFANIRFHSNAFPWFEYLISFCFVGIVQIWIFQRYLNVRKPCKSIKQLTAIWFCVSLLLPTFSEKKNLYCYMYLNFFLFSSKTELLFITFWIRNFNHFTNNMHLWNWIWLLVMRILCFNSFISNLI